MTHPTLAAALAIIANPITDTTKAAQLGVLWWRAVEYGAEDMAEVIECVACHDLLGLEAMFRLRFDPAWSME